MTVLKRLLPMLILAMLLFTGFPLLPQDDASEVPVPVNSVPPPDPTFTLVAVGDVMAHGAQIRGARTAEGHDFYPPFAEIAPFISGADVAMANLEVPLAGAKAGYSGYPRFNAPDALALALKKTGFDLITTANNHVLDRGATGLARTLDVLDGLGLAHVGSARTPDERDTFPVLEVNGLRVAFLSYTYGTNGLPLPKNQPYAVNLLSRKLMEEDLTRAREQADVVVLGLHFGLEYDQEPEAADEELVAWAVEKGADIVIGNHPHVLQPVRLRPSPRGQAVVAYSLGNFVSAQERENTDSSIILRVQVTKTPTGISIGKVSYLPTWVHRFEDTRFHIIPVEAALDNPQDYPTLENDDNQRLGQALTLVTNTMTEPLELWSIAESQE